MANRRFRRTSKAITACCALVLAGIVAVPASAMPASAGTSERLTASAGVPRGCPAPTVGQVTCAALVAPGSKAVRAGAVSAAALPPGYGPLSLRYAYGLEYSSLTGGVGQTVAVVTAFDDATAEADMGTYRSEYGIPACTTADGCFSKVDQTGGKNYPSPGTGGWDLVTAESLDMISAVCPNCHILLVEANSAGIPDLGPAEDEAVASGAKFVANTFYGLESSSETSDDAYFNHPGVAITAPDGNGGGYGTYYPAASPYVIAVGGTTLTAASGTARGWTETAWNQTSSGCSPYEAKPSWQADPDCTGRMLNDVSAVAATSTPVAFYDTTNGGWVSTGGTGIAASIIAAGYALAGTPAAGSNPASYLYAHTSQVNDITTGSDGTCAPAPAYYCTAETGYDGPSGVGTPASAAAFGAQAPAASLPAGPAAFNPVNGSQDLYGTGTNGVPFQDSWTPSGWSGWANLGGVVSGPLNGVYNPAANAMDVYATGTNGVPFQNSWTPSGWSGWTNLGGVVSGPLAAAYNPIDGAMDVYATGTNGVPFQNSWTPSGKWSGWVNLGGVVSGPLTAAYNPIANAMDVYATGTNGVPFQNSWTPSGWSGWTNLGGVVSGPPTAAYNPIDGAMDVYATGTNGVPFQDSWTPKGWSGWVNLGGVVSGPPTAAYNPAANAMDVYATGTNGVPFQNSWTPSGWSGWTNLGGVVSGPPTAAYNPIDGAMDVYALGTNGVPFQGSWTASGQWSGWVNLGGTLSGF